MDIPFHFHTRFNLAELLGRRARSIVELRDGIREVPGTSIYYHTHRFLQQHFHFSPEPPNDFAHWACRGLGLDDVAERLASVDTVRFHKIGDLRATFLKILDESLAARKNGWPSAREGMEFHFMSCRTFILPLPAVARNVEEFLVLLKDISINSLYFHFFEARLKLEKGDNDFSNWFEALGHKGLAEALSRLDPYTITLEGLRNKILSMVREHVENR